MRNREILPSGGELTTCHSTGITSTPTCRRVPGAAEQNAVNRTDVAVIAPPGESDVTVRGHAIIGGVEIHPSGRRGTTPNTRRATRRRRPNARGQAAAWFAGSRSHNAPGGPAIAGTRSADERNPGIRRGAFRRMSQPEW